MLAASPPGGSLVVIRIGKRILQPNYRFFEQDSSGHLRKVGPHRVLRLEVIRIMPPRTWGHVMGGDKMQQLAIETEHVGIYTAAERDRISHDRLEHRLHVSRRGTYHTKNLRGGLLLL